MEIPGARFFLSKKNHVVTALSQTGKTYVGGCLDTDIPFTDISFPELIAQIRDRIIMLKAEGAGFLLADTCKTLKQARAAVFASRKEGLPLAVCMDCDKNGVTEFGDHAVACLITLQALGVSAFGISGALTPEECTSVLEMLVPFAKLPLLASPTAGEPNPVVAGLYDLGPKKMAEAVLPILNCGVTILTENSGVTPEHAALLQKLLFTHQYPALTEVKEDEEDQLILANSRDFFVISDERLEFTDPIPCSQDMADDLLAAENESYDVLQIEINTPDDALAFSENVHLAALPVMFCADDEIALKAALLVYDGRAMVNEQCAIEGNKLQEIAEKYGCIIY